MVVVEGVIVQAMVTVEVFRSRTDGVVIAAAGGQQQQRQGNAALEDSCRFHKPVSFMVWQRRPESAFCMMPSPKWANRNR